MLEYTESNLKARVLAVHYANKIGELDLIEFMSGKKDISDQSEAEAIINGFWKMTDMAIEDNDRNVDVDGISDIEYWMHKLFNKIDGYMKRHGYSEQWKAAIDQR